MSAGRAERILVQHLVDPDSLAVLEREGMPSDVIPSAELRAIYNFSIDYFRKNGRTKAPSIETLTEEYGDTIADNEIEIETEPDDSIEYVIDSLKGSWINKEAQDFMRSFAEDVTNAEARFRPDVIGQYASRLVFMSSALERKSVKTDVREDMTIRLDEYHQRAADQQTFRGMRIGIPEVDAHTHGIHPGELAVFAAGPKVGKSFLMMWIAYNEWLAGRVAMAFSLENSNPMSVDRVACMGANVDYRSWQHGRCTPDEIERVTELAKKFEDSNCPLYIFQPDLGKRSFEHMVAQAQIYDADTLLIDQLTFVELEAVNKPKHERIGDALHNLKGMISTGRKPIPCGLAHQINRDGVKAADKLGYLEMYHMAEAAEIERTADWGYGMYASRDEVQAQRIKLQTLAARREINKNWNLEWQPSMGNIRVIDTFDIH